MEMSKSASKENTFFQNTSRWLLFKLMKSSEDDLKYYDFDISNG